jgi:DNA-binding GntR family transcriptional regulator
MGAARNAALQSTYRSPSGRVQRARFSAHKTDAQWAQAIDDHNLIVMLLRRREGGALAQVMRDHLKRNRPVISAAYSEKKSAARRLRSTSRAVG